MQVHHPDLKFNVIYDRVYETKCVLETGNMGTTKELAENVDSQAPPQTYW